MTEINREFTPAAQRAVSVAAGWVHPESPAGVSAQGILLGLIDQTECHAAIILAAHGIDASSVRRRWPGLTQRETFPQTLTCAPEVAQSLAAIDAQVDWGDWPAILSTEHLLFGLAAAEHEVGQWLRKAGILPDELLRRVLSRYDILPDSATLTGDEIDPEHVPSEEAETSGEDAGANAEPCAAQAETMAADTNAGKTPPSVAPQSSETLGIYRAIDAEANRCVEGMRVLEDYARFVLDDAHLTELIKTWRHDFAQATGRFPMQLRLAARNTPGDVGTRITTAGERHRADLGAVLAANFSRVAESLRALEEWSKVVVPEVSPVLEALRYRGYTLHRTLAGTRSARQRLAGAVLYVLIGAGTDEASLRRLVRRVLAGGADIVQLREKGLDDRTLLQRARAVRQETSSGTALFIMNDRPDLAVLAGADGVHVGQDELSVADARRIVGAERLVGVSTHSLEQARQAVADGADYIGVGPTFPSDTKSFASFPGPSLLREVGAEVRLPAFAIGGIHSGNLHQVLASGIQRIAVSGAVSRADDPQAATADLKAALLAAREKKPPA